VDLFGDLAGQPSAVDLAALERVLEGAAFWGAELDTRYRVLAVTVEPTAQRYPWGDAADRRIQVLCHPVSTILASLRRSGPDGRALLEFTEPQLVDVAAALGGAPLQGRVFGRPEPRPGEWGPQFSLQGRSTAGDGTAATLTLQLAQDDLTLDLFARFDVADLKDATGRELVLDDGEGR
jgi:hypothetical protein